jgi:hypothetical protein
MNANFEYLQRHPVIVSLNDRPGVYSGHKTGNKTGGRDVYVFAY